MTKEIWNGFLQTAFLHESWLGWQVACGAALLLFVAGILAGVMHTLLRVWQSESEPLPWLPLLTPRGLLFFWRHLHQRLTGGASAPGWKRFSAEHEDLTFFRLLLDWLPSGEIGGHLARLPADLADMEQQPRKSSKKKSSKNSTVSSSGNPTPAPPVPVTVSPPPPVMVVRPKKRHSLPAMSQEQPVVSMTGFVAVRRERTASQAEPEPESPTASPAILIPETQRQPSYEQHLEQRLGTPPTPMPIIIEEDKSASSEDESEQVDEGESESGFESGRATPAMFDGTSAVDKVESRFAQYFNSTPRTASTSSVASYESSGSSSSNIHMAIPGRKQSVSTGAEHKLQEGDLTPPPGFGRRTRSMAPRAASITSATSATQNPQNVNPNTTSSTTYRRPTGTFASKGYALTGESVFAARASPVDPKQAPLEKRTMDFFQQRLSVSRGSTPPASSASSSKTASPPRAAPSGEPQMHAPTGKRTNSLFPGTWSPWLANVEEDSVVPPGAHLRPAGVIGGSRPATASPDPTAPEHSNRKSSAAEPAANGNEYFSLFNMDLFQHRQS